MISKNGRSPVEPAAIASLNQLSDLIKRNQKKRSLLQGGYTESWKSSKINDFNPAIATNCPFLRIQIPWDCHYLNRPQREF